MIDFRNITKADLSNLGINIKDQREFERLTDFLLEELEVKIGERVSEGLTDEQLNEFDSLQSPSEASKWLETNKPGFRDEVREEHYKLIWKMLKNRKRISEGDSPDPGKLLDHIVLLGIDEYSLKRLCDADLLTIKDVVDCKDLLGISGMDEKHKKEVIIKIVDYLVN